MLKRAAIQLIRSIRQRGVAEGSSGQGMEGRACRCVTDIFMISPIELTLCVFVLVSICLKRVGIWALRDHRSPSVCPGEFFLAYAQH